MVFRSAIFCICLLPLKAYEASSGLPEAPKSIREYQCTLKFPKQLREELRGRWVKGCVRRGGVYYGL